MFEERFDKNMAVLREYKKLVKGKTRENKMGGGKLEDTCPVCGSHCYGYPPRGMGNLKQCYWCGYMNYYHREIYSIILADKRDTLKLYPKKFIHYCAEHYAPKVIKTIKEQQEEAERKKRKRENW